jgi:hypothetical protein
VPKTYALAIGDKVAYARGFLRSTGQYTGPEAPTHYGPFARGVVTGLQELKGCNGHALVGVLWADGANTRVLACNLVAVKRLHLEAA